MDLRLGVTISRVSVIVYGCFSRYAECKWMVVFWYRLSEMLDKCMCACADVVAQEDSRQADGQGILDAVVLINGSIEDTINGSSGRSVVCRVK